MFWKSASCCFTLERFYKVKLPFANEKSTKIINWQIFKCSDNIILKWLTRNGLLTMFHLKIKLYLYVDIAVLIMTNNMKPFLSHFLMENGFLKIFSVTVCCCESEVSVETILSFLNGYVSAWWNKVGLIDKFSECDQIALMLIDI